MPKSKKRTDGNDFNHALTSVEQGYTNSPSRVEIESLRSLSGKTVKAFRKKYKLSASALAARLLRPMAKQPNRFVSFSRSYVKRIEGGGLRPSPKFIKAFQALQAEFEQRPPPQSDKKIIAVFAHAVPDGVSEFDVLVPLVRCVCGRWFVPTQPRQKIHALPSCRRQARRLRA